jgi:hypothetical protein
LCHEDIPAPLKSNVEIKKCGFEDLRSAKGIKKVSKRLVWPLPKSDIKTTVGVLKTHQKSLLLAFQNDIFLVAQNIYEDLKLIQGDTKALCPDSSIIRKNVENVGDNLGMLTTMSKDGLQRIEGTIVASASKTSLDVKQISSMISVSSQKNSQSLARLESWIQQSGIWYTAHDFLYLDCSRRTNGWDIGGCDGGKHSGETGDEDDREVGSDEDDREASGEDASEDESTNGDSIDDSSGSEDEQDFSDEYYSDEE